jgi:hypothetical protein
MNAVERFVEEISTISFDNCFNPYADRCEVFDQPSGPSIRRLNLLRILKALEASKAVDLWVGRDLGYRGGRRTGLALTDECSLSLYASHLGISSLERSTSGPPVKERTAENIFRILRFVDVSVLTWNVFPLHPHEVGKPFTNRQHTRAEASVGFDFLERLCELFQVRNIIAIGNDAANWTRRLNANNHCVRHPSYGGQSIFLDQMSKIYEVSAPHKAQGELF